MSAFYDQASLVVVPSGYKSGKIYAQKPLTTDGQLTFTRASTATRVNASGLIETVSSGVPRLDYQGSTCPKLLLEPQRTNIAQHSQSFENGYWEKGSAATITANTVISPDGTQNADTLTANGTGGLFVRVNCYLGTAQTCSNSLFVKKANHRYVGFRNSGTFSQHDVFDFDTKTWTNNSGATLSYEEHANGWFRLKSTNTDAVNLNYYWSVIPAVTTAGTETTTASNLSVYIWGAQAEQNAAYCTSYIPTTSAAVTRLADYAYANQSPTANFGSGAFSVFFDIENVRNMSGNASDLTAFVGNRQSGTWWRFFGQPGPNVTQFEVQGANGYNAPVIGTFTQFANGRNKVAISRSATRFLCYVNGVEVINSTNAVYLSNFDSTNTRIELSDWNNGATHPTNAKFNQLLIFKGTALTAAQLAELTTL